MSGDQLQNSRHAEPQRQYCVGAGLYHPHCCKFGRWPPASPVQSRLDREALGAQTFHLQLPEGSFGTNCSRHHCPLLPSPGVGQPDPLRRFVSCLYLRSWFTALAGGGCLSTLVQGGLFPTLIRGRLASILTSSRGSRCRGPSLGRPLWVRLSAWSGHVSFGYRLPLEVGSGL